MTFLQKRPCLSSREQIALLILVVLALYFPAISGTINSIDDVGIMTFFGSDRLTLLDILKPGPGYYYRPIISLSFFFDYHVLGHNTSLMHLENILIHAANVALLLLLAKRLVPAASTGLPLAAALLFAVHPVNSEAVNWIAGRTDPLAALFVLLAALCLCQGLQSGRIRYTVLSVLLTILGGLTKETALAFVPASFLLAAAWRRQHPEAPEAAARLQIKTLCLFWAAILAVVVALFVYRSGAHGNSIGKLLGASKLDALESLVLCLKIAGFYLKKMVVPWPLNFAITSVAGWYLVPAGAALLAIWRAPKGNPYYSCLAAGLLFLLPAVMVALCGIAWTVVAERYLYIPSAFFSLALVGYLCLAADRMRLNHLVLPVFFLCLAAAIPATLDRIRVWHSNITLYEDAIKKSPDFGNLHNELAVALIQANRFSEAEQHLKIASSLDITPTERGFVRRNLLLMRLKATESPEERRRIIAGSDHKWSQEDTELLAILRQSDYLILRKLPEGEQKAALVNELVEISDILYARTSEPLLLYNNGQLCLGRGDRKTAVSYFTRSYRAAPDGALYKRPAGLLVERLGGTKP